MKDTVVIVQYGTDVSVADQPRIDALFKAFMDAVFGVPTKRIEQRDTQNKVFSSMLDRPMPAFQNTPAAIWHYGPPPSLGWWPVKPYITDTKVALRWWNGSCWGHECYPDDSITDVEHFATALDQIGGRDVRWAYRPLSWPLHSRT